MIAALTIEQKIAREHCARVLGYQERLAGQVTVIPRFWSRGEIRAYRDGVAAAERQLGVPALIAERMGTARR